MLEGKISDERQRGEQRLTYLEGLVLASRCGAVDIWGGGGQATVLVSDTW